MSGAHRVWTPEQRAAQRDRLAARRASMEAKRIAALRTPKHRAYAAERQRKNRRNPDYNARQAKAMGCPDLTARRTVLIRAGWARRRAARIVPPEYRETFDYLVANLSLSERQAREIVWQQHGWDQQGGRPFDIPSPR